MHYSLEPTDGNSEHPCGICSLIISYEHKAILCDFCNTYNHIECEGIDKNRYDALKGAEDLEFHCCKFCEEEMIASPQKSLVDEISSIENTNFNILSTPILLESPVEEEISYCGICLKRVAYRHKSVQCDLCDKWHHIKCDGIDSITYDSLKKSSVLEKHFCKSCKEVTFPFQKLPDNESFTSIVKNIDINEDLNLQLTPPPTLKRLFTDLSSHNKDEPSPINCDYYDSSSRIPSCNNANHSMFHLNLASLGRHKDELVTALSLLDFQFDIIAITETKIKAGIEPNYDQTLPGYKHYQTPTESEKGGVIIYVKGNIDIKRREDLERKMYKSSELESVFLEIINEGK